MAACRWNPNFSRCPQGFPVGYLIAWRNPTVKLKDGTTSAGKRILIDGQQRVTALMASLLGMEVLTKDYERVRIRIAFNPLATDDEPSFEVSNPAIAKNPAWIPDVSKLSRRMPIFLSRPMPMSPEIQRSTESRLDSLCKGS